MLGSAPARDPDRLTVQLPPASLDATARLIGDYAAQWGLPATAVDALARQRIAARAGRRPLQHTRLHAEDIGSVHLEFQVSHHMPERAFVVTALFSWHSHAA